MQDRLSWLVQGWCSAGRGRGGGGGGSAEAAQGRRPAGSGACGSGLSGRRQRPAGRPTHACAHLLGDGLEAGGARGHAADDVLGRRHLVAVGAVRETGRAGHRSTQPVFAAVPVFECEERRQRMVRVVGCHADHDARQLSLEPRLLQGARPRCAGDGGAHARVPHLPRHRPLPATPPRHPSPRRTCRQAAGHLVGQRQRLVAGRRHERGAHRLGHHLLMRQCQPEAHEPEGRGQVVRLASRQRGTVPSQRTAQRLGLAALGELQGRGSGAGC